MSTDVADSSVGQSDGRRRRGDASRAAILSAATRVIVAEGVASVSHRRVAEEAGMPLARISYHFPTVDDLLVAGTTNYLDGFDEELKAMATRVIAEGTSIVDACTEFLLELVSARGDEFLAMVEVRLALHRRGRAVDDLEVVEVIRSFGADEQRAASIVAALFGFAVLAATTPRKIGRDQVSAYVRMILDSEETGEAR